MKTTGNNGSAGRFWSGVLTGVFASLFILTAAGYYLVRAVGVAVAIDQESMAKNIKDRVQVEAAKEMPDLLAKLKQEIPQAIAKNMTDFDQISIQIGDNKFPLPPESTKVFKDQFQGMAEEAVIATIDNFQADPYIREIGQASYNLVKKTLHEEVLGKTFFFQAYRWLTLPITVQAK